MADISMCTPTETETECPQRDTCYRFTAKACEYRQAYFLTPPIEDGVCKYYWEEILDNKE